MLLAVLSGLLAGLSLIVAIGAQNAYVLRRGLGRSHVLLVVAVCAISDAVLIGVGVAGLGTLITHEPAVLTVVRFAGATFLLGYAAMAARRAIRGESMGESAGAGPQPWPAVLVTTLALTWLNPHVYLDTVLLLGSMAAGHDKLRWWFALGAMLGSVAWFTALGFGARALVPLFRRRASWQVLDAAIALVMILLALQLLIG